MNSYFIIEIGTLILQEDKAEREKPEEKKTWKSGAEAWVRKHGMIFDTLKTLQFAGWLSLSIGFIFSFPILRVFLINWFYFFPQ